MWNQHHQAHHGQLHPCMEINHRQPPPPGGLLMAPRPAAPAMAGASGILPVSDGAAPAIGGSSVRPGSMAERARMSKIPHPEPGLKCPRCDSTNTKFCYFNNYNLSQPRHFCKTCRRYWTRGGALRNVPVGGGCRRNKRGSKSSKKPNSSSTTSATAAAVSAACGTSSSAAAAGLVRQQLHLPFGSLHAHHSHGIFGGAASRLGFPEISSLHPGAVDYQLGDGIELERPRLPPVQHQFPFLTRANTAVPPPPPGTAPLMPAGITYPIGDVEAAGFAVDLPASANLAAGSAGFITQMASVKMDDIENPSSTATNSSPREFLGLSGSLQFWGSGGCDRGGGDDAGGGSAAPGGVWSDLPAFDLSTSRNMM
ncbi:hypothetical protein ABZP36_002081 [Zizania latifolia]